MFILIIGDYGHILNNFIILGCWASIQI